MKPMQPESALRNTLAAKPPATANPRLALNKPIEPRIQKFLTSPLRRLILLCMAFATMCVHLHTRLYMQELQGRDYRYYLRMEATRSLEPAPAPFAYRWVPHKIIPYVPLPPKRVHEVLNVFAMCATAWVITEWLVRLGYDVRLVLPVVVLGFTWSTFGGVYFLWGRFATEPVTYLLLALGLYLARFGALWQLVIVTIVATLSREQALLLVPYYYLVRRGVVSSRQALGGTLLLGAVALATFVFVRLVTPTTGDYRLTMEIAQNLTTKFGSFGGLATLVVSLLTHSGLIPLVLVLLPIQSLEGAKRNPAIAFWLMGNFGLAIIGGAETDRIAFSAFPAELFLMCWVLTRIGFAWTIEWMPALVVFVLGQVAMSGTFADGRVHLPNYTPFWCATSAMLWTIALWLCCRGRLSGRARLHRVES